VKGADLLRLTEILDHFDTTPIENARGIKLKAKLNLMSAAIRRMYLTSDCMASMTTAFLDEAAPAQNRPIPGQVTES